MIFPFFRTLLASHDERAKRYERIHNWLVLVDVLLIITFLVALLIGGPRSLSARLDAFIASRIIENHWGQIAIYVPILSAVYAILTLPYAYWKGYRLEKQFELSTQSPRAWLVDALKSFLLSTTLALILFQIFYALIRSTGFYWWIWAALAWILLQVILGMLFPVCILPLFYRTEKYDDPLLTQQVQEYARDTGISVIGIFRFALSEKTKKANAMLAGLGKTKRILLGDTLLNDFSSDEIISVLAHEFGHFYHKHLRALVTIAAISAFLGMAIAHYVLFALSKQLGLFPDTIATAPLLILALFLFSVVSMPVVNIFSRYFERQADAYALRVTQNPDAFINAMERLADTNLAQKEPHPVIEFLLHSHPSIGRRIAAARAYANEISLE